MSSNGRIDVIGSGGTAPYQFALLPNAYQGSGSFLGLDTGTYTINAIDANGCFTTRNENIAPAYTLSVTLDTAAGISCSGFADGQVNRYRYRRSRSLYLFYRWRNHFPKYRSLLWIDPRIIHHITVRRSCFVFSIGNSICK